MGAGSPQRTRLGDAGFCHSGLASPPTQTHLNPDMRVMDPLGESGGGQNLLFAPPAPVCTPAATDPVLLPPAWRLLAPWSLSSSSLASLDWQTAHIYDPFEKCMHDQTTVATQSRDLAGLNRTLKPGEWLWLVPWPGWWLPRCSAMLDTR